MNKRHGKYYLYIVQCTSGTYQTGSTKDLDNRIKLHNSGRGAKYLRGKLPVKLVYMKEYKYYKNVLRAEREIKTYTRKEKEKLIKAYENKKTKQ